MQQATLHGPVYGLSVILGISMLAISIFANAAVEVQPDIRVGASHIYADTVSGEQSESETGAQVFAEFRIAFFDERGEFAIVPMIMETFYDENDALGREEQAIALLWNREYRTGDASLDFNFSRADLFSSEFEDVDTSPGTGGDSGSTDSGLVSEGSRDLYQLFGSLSKQVTRRGSLIADFDLVDIYYSEEQGFSRVDFTQLFLTVGWQLQISERSSWTLFAGGRDYAGENDVDVRSYRGDLRFETQLTPNVLFSATAGFENLDAELAGIEIASEDAVPFAAELRRNTERTRYRLLLDRNVIPISTGEFEERTRASFLIEHSLSRLFTVNFGVTGYRDEQFGPIGSIAERDYIGASLDFDWAIGRRWSLGFEYYRNEQDFSDADVQPNLIKSRDEFFLNLRYRGLSKAQPDARTR